MRCNAIPDDHFLGLRGREPSLSKEDGRLCWLRCSLHTLTCHTLTDSHISSGNNLGNECVSDILSVLSLPEAPQVRQLDFSTNTRLNWRVSIPLATALGADASAHAHEPGDPECPETPLPASPIEMLRLSRLMLSGVKLCDKGAIIIAGALTTNRILKV